MPQLGDLFAIFIGDGIFIDNSVGYSSAFFATKFVFPTIGTGLYFNPILGTNTAGQQVLSLLVSGGSGYTAVPEPGALALFAFGLFGLVAAARMRPASPRLPVSQ